MSKPLGMGVVGAGSIGIRGALEHLTMPDVQDRVKVTAVCDPVPGRAKAAAGRYGVAGHYETLEELLADPAVDAVTLCSPIGVHYEQGLAAIKAGKHIHFNKTMTVGCDEALDLIKKAKAAKVELVASPGQMIRGANQHIRRLIANGEIGRLAWSVTGAAFGDYHDQERLRTGQDVLSNINPSWYWQRHGGGPLYDMTVYGLHTLTGILGPAKKVTAMSASQIKEREFRGEMYKCDAADTTLMVLDFGSGRFAFVYGTLNGNVSNFGQPSFFGTQGSIVGTKLNNKELTWPGKRKTHFFGPHVTGPHVGVEEAHVFEDMMQLVDLVREGTPTLATAEHAAHVIEIIEAGLKSAEDGKAVGMKSSFEPISV